MPTPVATAEAAPSKKHGTIYSLQILRGVAAFLVLMRHSAKFATGHGSADAFGVGQAGVDVFFIISGVVIYITGRSLDWHVFVRRRIARIVPLYWLILTAAAAAMALPQLLHATGFRPNGAMETYNAITSYLFIPSFDEKGEAYPLIVAGWTLNFEMYFYLICTLALLFAPRRLFLETVSLIVVAMIAIGAPLFWAVDSRPAFAPLVLTLPISLEFVAGLWIAHAWVSGFRTSLPVNAAILAVAIIWFALSPVAGPYSVWRPFGWGIPAAMVVWAMLASEEKIAFAKWRPALLLGDASYALYLTHPVVLSFAAAVLTKMHLDLPVAAKLAFAIALSLAVGIVTHKLVELPAVKIASHMLGISRRRRVPATG